MTGPSIVDRGSERILDRVDPFERLDPAAVVGSIGRLLSPAEADVAPPRWLREHQVGPFRRAVAVVRARGGVMVSLPVGSGKTYLSLAVAAVIAPGESVAVAGPAILEAQWCRVADSVGIPIAFRSDEALSRGRLLAPSSVAIVDESHRFRDPKTGRYRALAPDLSGRRAILVTATPVVNRLADLAAQLLLAFRDDVLRLDGVPSLATALGLRNPPALLGRLVVTGTTPPELTPSRSESSAIRWDDETGWLAGIVRALDRLRLSRNRGVAALIRTAFYRALASSPAALQGSLRRYRRLLAHAADARRAGHPVNRAAIRATIATDPDQLVLWELLDADPAPVDLALGDHAPIARILQRLGPDRAGSDPKLDRLRDVLREGPPTVVFTTAVETVDHLRHGLGRAGVAWLTGARAGISGLPATRAAVLAGFDPATIRPEGIAWPRVLLTTDVAAEGLNLQLAGRVVHYDLPWTAVRLRQRDGRAVRVGSRHREVEVVTFAVPDQIEIRLAIQRAVDRKALLGVRVGLAADAERVLSAERRIAGRWSGGTGLGWTATESRWQLAGARLSDGAGSSVAMVLARRGPEPWSDDSELVEEALREIAVGQARVAEPDEVDRAVDSLVGPIGQRVALANGGALFGSLTPARGLPSIRAQCERCRRERRWSDLARWERGLRFLSRARTAGESILAARIVAGDPTALDAIGPDEAPPALVRATLVCLAI